MYDAVIHANVYKTKTAPIPIVEPEPKYYDLRFVSTCTNQSLS